MEQANTNKSKMAEDKVSQCNKVPRVVKFAYIDYKFEKNSLSGKCRFCKNKVITEKCGTTSNFVKHLERMHTDRLVTIITNNL